MSAGAHDTRVLPHRRGSGERTTGEPDIPRLVVNSLIGFAEGEEEPRVCRLLHLDVSAGEAALIAVQDPKAFPTWEAFGVLEGALRAGTMRLLDKDPWFADTRPDGELSEASRRIRDARLAVLAPLVDPCVDPDQRVLRPSERGALVASVHDVSGAAVDKIYDWLRLWWRHGQIANALLPGLHRCGRRRDGQARVVVKKLGRPGKLALAEPGREGMNVTEPIRQLLVRGALRFWGRRVEGRVLSLRDAYRKTLETYFALRLELRGTHLVPVVWESPADDARLPTFRQFCYWLGKARREPGTEEAITRARLGPRRYELTARPVMGTSEHLSAGPGDQYQIDATTADLYLVSSLDRRRIVGRPVLYLVVDHWSGMIVGLYVGFEGPSWLGAMMALENALTEKVSFCASYGVTISAQDWPCDTMPRGLTADRAELISGPSDGLVPGLGLTVRNLPAARGDLKSFVEGQFKITNETGISRLPGWVDKRRDRGGPDYRLDAVLTVREFTRIVIDLALHNNLRRRLNPRRVPREFPLPEYMDPRPIDLWTWGVEHRLGLGRQLPREQVRVSLLRPEPARATHHGLSVRSELLLYDSATARAEGWFQHVRGREGRQVELAVDDRDVTFAYLRLDGKPPEKCPLTPAHMRRYAGKSLDEVLNERELLSVGAAATQGLRLQERIGLDASVQATVEAAREEQRRAFREAEVRPILSGRRDARREERGAARREQAFTRQDTGNDVLPAIPPTTADDEDEYIPFPS